MEKQVAWVTGANKGLGLAAVKEMARRGYRVVMGSRDLEKGLKAASGLINEGMDVTVVELDVSSDESTRAAADKVRGEFGRCDVLINNAGISGETKAPTALETSLEEIQKVFNTNTLGALRMAKEVVPMMKSRDYGRIVNVSSGMGQLSDMQTGWFAYRISKASLNVLTRVLAGDLKGSHILVNSVCPGWVRTDMGGSGANRSLDEGVAGIIWAATLPDNGPTNGFFRDGEPIDW